MSAPDPEGMSLLAKVLAAAAAVVAPIWGAYSWLDGKLAKKADKVEVDRHRDYFVKVFEKLEEHAKRDEDNFNELKDLIHRNHVELLREKADK